MPLDIITNRLDLDVHRGLINACITQVNTNTTDIAAAQVDIAQNTSDISNLDTSKQDATAVSTLRDGYDNTETGNYTLKSTDKNIIYDITNVGATVFNLPASGTIPLFLVGDKVIVVNNESSGGNIVLTPTGGSILQTGNLSATLTPGDSAWVIRTGSSRYKRIF